MQARVVPAIVLASASPRRYELLRSLGLSVEIAPSGYHEEVPEGVSPEGLAQVNAREKLGAALAARPLTVLPVVAADTVVDVDGVVLDKPSGVDDAKRMLRLLSGRDHRVHTAFALALPDFAIVEELSTTRVRFYPLAEDEISAYVATGEPFDKAGAYGIQGRAAALVESIEGDFYTVMGFPLARFVRVLRRLGFSLPAAKPVAP